MTNQRVCEPSPSRLPTVSAYWKHTVSTVSRGPQRSEPPPLVSFRITEHK